MTVSPLQGRPWHALSWFFTVRYKTSQAALRNISIKRLFECAE